MYMFYARRRRAPGCPEAGAQPAPGAGVRHAMLLTAKTGSVSEKKGTVLETRKLAVPRVLPAPTVPAGSTTVWSVLVCSVSAAADPPNRALSTSVAHNRSCTARGEALSLRRTAVETQGKGGVL